MDRRDHPLYSRVVGKNIDRPECVLDFFDEGCSLSAARNVRANEDRPATALFQKTSGLLPQILVKINDRNRCRCLSQFQRDGAANAAAPSCHKGD
jgi:hypothetical protein